VLIWLFIHPFNYSINTLEDLLCALLCTRSYGYPTPSIECLCSTPQIQILEP
jgi:hypothetical protein